MLRLIQSHLRFPSNAARIDSTRSRLTAPEPDGICSRFKGEQTVSTSEYSPLCPALSLSVSRSSLVWLTTYPAQSFILSETMCEMLEAKNVMRKT